MKLFVDLTTRRFVKSAASSAALPTLVLKRRDLLPIEVIFVQRGAPVAAPSGTVTKVALKQSFGDSNFLAVADSGYLDLYTAGVEALLPGDTSKADALLEVRYARPGETTRTATLQVEIQNSVILGTEGTPAAIPDGKATQTEATTGTDNERWMTPLRTAQAIAALSAGGVTSYNDLTDKPTLGTAAATASSDYATASQGTKADTALQPSALTPYRTSAAQDLIDAGKASSTHDHDGRYYTETEMDTLLAGKQPTGSYATAAQGTKADTALQPASGLTYNGLFVPATHVSSGKTSYNISVSQGGGTTSYIIQWNPSGYWYADVSWHDDSDGYWRQYNQAIGVTDLPWQATWTATAGISGGPAPTILQAGGLRMSEVIGLNIALDGKQAAGSYAPTSHTHPLSQLEQSSATNGQVPTWNSATLAWVPQTPTGLASNVVVSNTTGITGADQVTNIVSLTQAEYDAIVTPSASTLYIITD
jgi:hypothetical protein